MTKDYSFNADIIAALKEGKPVWTSFQGVTWFEVTAPNAWGLTTTYNHKWSLTKPKEIVKKWQFIYMNVHRPDTFFITVKHYKTGLDFLADMGNPDDVIVRSKYPDSMIEAEE